MTVKIKSVNKNDDGENEVTLILTKEPVIILQEAMKFYDDSKKGDVDDQKKLKIRKDLRDGLHESWKAMNPS